MNDLFEEINRRLAALSCLADVTRHAVIGTLRGVAESERNARCYRDEVLPRVEHLHSLAASSVAVVEYAADRTAAGAVDPTHAMLDGSYEAWSEWLDRNKGFAASGYGLVNLAAVVLLTRERVLEYSPLAESSFANLEWNVRHHVCGDGPGALRFLESWIGLPGEEYPLPVAADCAHRLIERHTFCIGLRVLYLLNQSLLRTMRVGDVLKINACVLSITDRASHAPADAITLFAEHDAQLGRDLEKLQRLYGSEAVERMTGRQYGRNFYLCNAIKFYTLACNAMEDLVASDVIYGSYFGLSADGPMRFDVLSKRLATHGPVETREGIGFWIEALQASSRFEIAVTTLGAACRTILEAEPDILGDPGILAPDSVWNGSDRNAAAFVLLVALNTLQKSESSEGYESGLRLYREVTGLAGTPEMAEASERPRRWLRAVETDLRDEIVLTAASLLYVTGRVRECSRLFDDHFLLDSLRFENIDQDRKRLFDDHPLLRKNALARGKLLAIIGESTLFDFYNEQFLVCVELFFPGMARDPEQHYEHFLADIRDLRADHSEFLLSLVAMAQSACGKVLVARCLMERHLGVSTADYRLGPEAVAHKLRTWSTPARRLWQVYHISALHDALSEDPDMRNYAAVLAEGFLGLSDESFADAESAREAVRSATTVVATPAPLVRNLMFGLAGDYAATGRPHHALAVFGALLGVDDNEQYVKIDWLARLAVALKGVTRGRSMPIVTFGIMKSFVSAVQASGEVTRIQAVAEYFFANEKWLDPDEAISTPAVYDIAHFLIDHFAADEPDRAWRVVRRTIPHLRWFLATRLSEDRVRVAARCEALRHRVIRLCDDFDADDLYPSSRSLALTLAWDNLFGQLLLCERIASAGHRISEWAGDDPVRIRPSLVTSPVRKTTNSKPALLHRLSSTSGPTEPVSPAALATTVEPLPDAALKRLQALTLDEDRLGALLGPCRALLRAGFASDGRLVWAVYQADSDELVVRGRGVSAAGLDARRAITVAVAEHEEAVRDAWERYRLSITWDEVPLRRGLTAVEGLFTTGQNEGLPAAVRRLETTLKRYGLERYYKRLIARFPGLDPTGPATNVPDLDVWRAFWEDLRSEALPAGELEPHLDRVTDRLLDTVAGVWDMIGVANALAAAGSSDLLVQANGVLHAVPIAFLPLGGGRLFEAVPAIHSIFSLGVDEWLAELDRSEFAAAADAPDRVMSVSWLPPKDTARKSVSALHQGHAALIESRPGLEVYRASDPSQTHATLARGLAAHGAFRVVSVCGHGVNDGRGIELGDGVWTGDTVCVPISDSPPDENWVRSFAACDLREVELLVQVSCSVGRVLQPDGEDAEGVSLDLAVRGCRAVVAGRWPLHAGHAVVFANRLASHYLNVRSAILVETGESVADALVLSAPRARAIAAVRKEWIEEYRAGKTNVGLNTIAAFELYGRG